MQLTFEVCFTKKFVSKEEWLEFIIVISKYHSFLKKWSIIITFQESSIHYFVITNCLLPVTISHLDFFVLKRVKNIVVTKKKVALPFFSFNYHNLVDIYDFFYIKKKANLKWVEITFRRVAQTKFLTVSNFFFLFKKIKQKRLLFGVAPDILSIDFDKNKRFIYKGAPKYLDVSKSLELFHKNRKRALFQVDAFPYVQDRLYLDLYSYNFYRHSVVVGSSGCGKSKFVSKFIYDIYSDPLLRKKYKVVVIDPHASLENDIGGFGRVIDFKTEEDSMDLFINKKDDVISSVELLLSLLKSLLLDQYNSKVERVLRHAIYLLLVKEDFYFASLRKLLLDPLYRNLLIKELEEELPVSVVEFFLTDFNELKTKSYTEAISPIISFIDEMEMLPVFERKNEENNLESLIEDNFLTLFSLDRTKIGDKITKTIAGLIMQQMLTFCQTRSFSSQIIFIVDEVSVVENPILLRFLAEARKYGLSLILIGQYFNQISKELQDAIFANVLNYYIFRVSRLDANVLVDNFLMKIPLDDSRNNKIKLLTELNNREVVLRVSRNNTLFPAFKAKTMDFVGRARVKKSSVSTKCCDSEEIVKCSFKIGKSVSLKSILEANSTGRGDE